MINSSMAWVRCGRAPSLPATWPPCPSPSTPSALIKTFDARHAGVAASNVLINASERAFCGPWDFASRIRKQSPKIARTVRETGSAFLAGLENRVVLDLHQVGNPGDVLALGLAQRPILAASLSGRSARRRRRGLGEHLPLDRAGSQLRRRHRLRNRRRGGGRLSRGAGGLATAARGGLRGYGSGG